MSVTPSASTPESSTATSDPAAASTGTQPNAAATTRARTAKPVVSSTAERVRRNAPVNASTTQRPANVVARPGGAENGSTPMRLSPNPAKRSVASAIGKALRNHDLYQSRRRSTRTAAAKVIQTKDAARLPIVGGAIEVILLIRRRPITNSANTPAAATRRYASFSSARRASSARFFSIATLRWPAECFAFSWARTASAISDASAARESRTLSLNSPPRFAPLENVDRPCRLGPAHY